MHSKRSRSARAVAPPKQPSNDVTREPSEAFSAFSEIVQGSSTNSSRWLNPNVSSKPEVFDDADEAVWMASAEKPRRHSCPLPQTPDKENTITATPRIPPPR